MNAAKSLGAQVAAQERRSHQQHELRVAGVLLAMTALLVLLLLQFRFDPAYIWENKWFVIAGLATTIYVSFLSIALATVLAFAGALGRLSTSPLWQGISSFYVSLFRGTPLLIQIYIIYLGLPQIGQTLREAGYPAAANWFILSATVSGVLALALNYGAYMTEIFRAGIQSVNRGQWQAADALGMTRWQTLRLIVLPQALRTVFPAIVNQFISMQKDSSLVSVMGIWEITYRANRFARKDSKYMEMFLLAAAIYWLMTVISEWVQGKIEARFAESDRR